MGRMSIDIPTTLKKMEPKTGSLRRTSTGNSIMMKTNEPNNPRVPCNDISIKRASAVKPWRPVGRILDKNVDISMDKDRKGIKALTSSSSSSPYKAMSSVSSRQHHSELSKLPKTFKTDAFSRTSLDKNASLQDKDHRGKKALAPVSSKPKTCKPIVTISHQPPAPKQSIRTLLSRESQNDAGKEVIKPPTKSIPPRPLTPKLLPTAKSRTEKKDSQPEIKNKTCNVPEKVIHAIEPEDDNNECGNMSPVQESHINCTGLVTNHEESDNGKKGTEEKCSSPTKLMNRSGKVSPPAIENIGNARSMLRRPPVCEGKAVKKMNESSSIIGGGGVVLRHEYAGWKNGDSVLLNIVIEERASNLVKMRKSKVEALVGAFQSVITKTQHSS